MKQTLRKSVLSITLAASVMGGAAWSNASYACSAEPYISSVCIMGLVRGYTFDGFMPANGALLNVNQYQAVFSLISNTYGGNGSTNFNLPDLRGRVVIGAGQGIYANAVNYKVGQTGGFAVTPVTLAAANLPAHTHTLTTSPTGVTVTVGGNITAATTLSGLTTTTTLTGIPFASTNSNLQMQATSVASSALPGATTTLAKLTVAGGGTPSTASTLYGTGAPNIPMAFNSVIGTVSGTLNGTAPGTVSGGTATTTITGLPSVTIGGQTNVAGTGTPVAVPTMMPYLVMNYYFSTSGVYPIESN
jgi:microcystin-dependent protein